MKDEFQTESVNMSAASQKADVQPQDARSWLLVPGSKPELFDGAARSAADAVVLDIEDAVAPEQKPEARANVKKWLENGGRAYVRINDAESEFWRDDLEELGEVPGLVGVMLAKTEEADHVNRTGALLGDGKLIVALIESAVGIENVSSIAKAESTFRLAFGTGDFRRDTDIGDDHTAMAYSRSRMVLASRAARLPGPIDGPVVTTETRVLVAETAHSLTMGLLGKICLRPEQTGMVNEILSPTTADLEWAQDVTDSFDARGGVIRDGSDLPRLARARKIMTRAKAYGLL